MSERKEHVANEVAREVDALTEEMVEAIETELGYYMGAEEVGNREVRGLIRRALAEGIASQPFAQVMSLVGEQPTSPNPVIAQIAIVMEEMEG